MQPKPKVVFVDWDGTLSRSTFWAPVSGAKLTRRQANQICTFVFANSPDLVQDWMRGRLTSESVADILAQRFRLDPDVILADLRLSCQNMRLINPLLAESVLRLRQKGIKVVIATDNMDTFVRWTVPSLRLDEIFDAILDSPTRGALKADIVDGYSLFFDHYLTQENIQPHEAVLLDDNADNDAVRSRGIRFIHINEDAPANSALNSLA